MAHTCGPSIHFGLALIPKVGMIGLAQLQF
jgi:hypothetical protein